MRIPSELTIDLIPYALFIRSIDTETQNRQKKSKLWFVVAAGLFLFTLCMVKEHLAFKVRRQKVSVNSQSIQVTNFHFLCVFTYLRL